MRTIAQLLAFILSIYNMLIIIRILLLWIRLPQGTASVVNFSELLGKIVDPYLNLFKGIGILRRGRFDLTPLAAFMVLNILQRIFSTYAVTGQITLGYVLALIFQSLWWSLGSLLLGLLCVVLAIRLYFCYRRTQNSIQYITMLDTWINWILDPIHQMVFGGKEVSDRILISTTLILCVLLYAGLSIGINFLTGWLMALRF
jgi:YggT family protein